MENLSTVVPGAMGLLQAKEEGTRKTTVSLLPWLVFLNPLKKVPDFVWVQSIAVGSFEPLPEHRMWPTAPSPLAMEILLIRIRISRFPANLELERVIWGRRMQNKMWNDSLPFNKGWQALPFAQKKLDEIIRPSLKKQMEHWLGFWVVRTWRSWDVIKVDRVQANRTLFG